jgi:hypothetical protein
MEIRSRWQRGFRRKSGSSAYIKVQILRVEIDFDPDQFELLPSEMSMAVVNSCSNDLCRKLAGGPGCQVAKLAHNRRYCAEFPFFAPADSCCEIGVRVSEVTSTTSLVRKGAAALVPEFSVKAANTGSDEWQLSTPEILQLF